LVRLSKCQFEENGIDLHVLDGAQSELEGGQMKSSKEGIVIVVSGEEIFLKATGIIVRGTHERKCGLIVGRGAKFSVKGSEFSGCKTCGVCLKTDCEGEFLSTQVRDMDRIGIQIDGGYASIRDNEITECKEYGVSIAPGAKPQVIGNTFSDNVQGNVNRE
jgi:parallel beta-helix repeat protein